MWEIEKVSRVGSNVTVKYVNKKDNNTTEERVLVWSYDEESFNDFKIFLEMVKREAKTYLDYLNQKSEEEDITDLFS